MRHACLMLLGVLWTAFTSYAQTPQFTQFYHAPMALNPAFAGTAEQYRLALLHRQQWLGAAARFATTHAAFDAHLPFMSSGMGIYLAHDLAPQASMQQTTLQGIYSFGVRLSKQYVLRMGLNAGVSNRSLSRSNLRFTSQVRPDEPDVFEGAGSDSRFFADIGAGCLLYGKWIWIGAAVLHLNRPDIAFLTGESAGLPRLYTVHAGTKLVLPTAGSGDVYLMPNLLFRQQAVAQQLDIGARIGFERFPVQVGIQYRGLPLQQSFGLPRHDALSAVVGIYQKNWQVAYSYDLPLSTMNRVTGGSHEIGIVYSWATRYFRQQTSVRCPVF
ncbi:MAG: PorP/SprF family type IX secretion system membrane protein [Cytophagales bacterium]|nr:PorP/SprF family type IX secretion system membrane protein [Bernardetiaceae bacterium]MDW8204901.1 PorP/SprF family type IX secretion system membrane protein [Cytophagales bacterium]